MEFRVVEMDGEIILGNDEFRAVYYRPDKSNPQLVLRCRAWIERTGGH